MIPRFFNWYNKHYFINIRFTAALFLLQIVHLLWLTSDVVSTRLFGVSFFPRSFDTVVALFDYTEIPALISVSLVYINDILHNKGTFKTWLYLVLLNSQWLHLFWITDEVVVANFMGTPPFFIPIWLSWTAIFIDYLELPVMYDTVKRALKVGESESVFGVQK